MYLKKDRVPTLTELNKILDSISHDDKIGHLFTADIKFDKTNEKTLLFNEIWPQYFKKQENRSIWKIHTVAYECND